MKDDVLGMAAELAYYFFLALFPALMFLISIASFFPAVAGGDRVGSYGGCAHLLLRA